MKNNIQAQRRWNLNPWPLNYEVCTLPLRCVCCPMCCKPCFTYLFLLEHYLLAVILFLKHWDRVVHMKSNFMYKFMLVVGIKIILDQDIHLGPQSNSCKLWDRSNPKSFFTLTRNTWTEHLERWNKDLTLATEWSCHEAFSAIRRKTSTPTSLSWEWMKHVFKNI